MTGFSVLIALEAMDVTSEEEADCASDGRRKSVVGIAGFLATSASWFMDSSEGVDSCGSFDRRLRSR